MPPRNRKALRDRNVTQNFFNQGEPSTDLSNAEQNRSIAGSLATSAGIDVEDEGLLRSRLTNLLNKNRDSLTSKETELVQKALETLPDKLDPGKVVETPDVTQEQNKSIITTIDERQPKQTFDLADLDKVAEEYVKQCKKDKLYGASQMAKLAKVIDEFTVIASDTTSPTEHRLAANLSVLNLNIHTKITFPLTLCLRQVQLFNKEKRFGLIEESYPALKIEDERKPGEDVPAESLLSSCQALNNSFKPTEPAPKPDQKEGEKKISGLEALTQLQHNLKLASEEIQDLKATNDTQDFEELSDATPILTYADVPIPQAIPDHIRQRFLDADFALNQLDIVMKEASEQMPNVRSTLKALNTVSQEVWEHTKKVADEMPLLRKYEYNRIASNAMLLIISRQEVKITEFYSDRQAPEFPLAMRQAFKLGSMTLEEFEKHWEMQRVGMHDRFPSVDKIIAVTEDAPE